MRAALVLLWLAAVGCAGETFAPDATLTADASTADGGLAPDRGDADASPQDATETPDAGPDAGPEATVDAGPPDGGLAPPAALVRYMTGDPADRAATPTGPALILMGGGPEVDGAFDRWRAWLDGGDVVVLRTSGSDGYNDYLYEDIGGVDSVETLLVTDRALADHPYVEARLRGAEGIFLAGGDQSTYIETWTGTAVQAALQDAWARGAVLGGTSAGLAVLGAVTFDALEGGVGSQTALEDPYGRRMTLGRGFLELPPLARVITDSHFAERDRMGRLAAFVARAMEDGWLEAPIGLGLDERTALVIGPDGAGEVLGRGAVYLLQPTAPPEVCAAGRPLTVRGLQRRRLEAGAIVQLPSGATTEPPLAFDVVEGALSVSDPY